MYKFCNKYQFTFFFCIQVQQAPDAPELPPRDASPPPIPPRFSAQPQHKQSLQHGCHVTPLNSCAPLPGGYAPPQNSHIPPPHSKPAPPPPPLHQHRQAAPDGGGGQHVECDAGRRRNHSMEMSNSGAAMAPPLARRHTTNGPPQGVLLA